MSVCVASVSCGERSIIVITRSAHGAVVSSVSANSRSLLTGDLPPGESYGGTRCARCVGPTGTPRSPTWLQNVSVHGFLVTTSGFTPAITTPFWRGNGVKTDSVSPAIRR